MRTVTATASGRAEGTPDTLTAQVGISNVGPAAGTVMAENNRLAAALLEKVVALGIDPADFATASVGLHPEYDREGQPNGYRATNMLSVRFRDLATAGAQLDELLVVGGDTARIDHISLGFADEETLLDAARADGVRRAVAQARDMAEAAGAGVGQVLSITDDVADSPGTPRFGFAAEAMSVRKADVPIAAGSKQISVEVRVVVELT